MVQISFKWMRQCTEIPVLLLFFSFMVCDPVNTNFIIYRTCYVTLNYSEAECAKLGSKNADNYTHHLEKIVQPYANYIMMTQSMMTQIVPALLCLFLGPWSDKHGRKPILICTLLGFTIASVVPIIVALISSLSPWYLLAGSIPAVLFGGFSPFLMAVLCYIADITTEENRGMRIGIFEVVLVIGMLAGTLPSSYIFSYGGYVTVFALGAFANLFSCLYVIFVLTESVSNTAEHQHNSSIFTLEHIKDMLRTTFRPREAHSRCILLIAISMATLYILAANSDSAVFFMFLRDKLHWSLEQYTLYRSVRELLYVAGTFSSIYLLHKVLKVPEEPMLLLGFASYGTAMIVQGLASASVHIYFAGCIKCISGVVSPMIRSLISKLVYKEETGKVFAITIAVESLTVMVGAPLYTFVYNYTLDTNPGAFNFMTAGMFGGLILLVATVITLQKNNSNPNPYAELSINTEELE